MSVKSEEDEKEDAPDVSVDADVKEIESKGGDVGSTENSAKPEGEQISSTRRYDPSKITEEKRTEKRNELLNAKVSPMPENAIIASEGKKAHIVAK